MSSPTAIVQLDRIPAVACPCGTARRGFADRPDFPATVHLTEITQAARVHYHRQQTEVYVVLDCSPDAAIELDGVRTPVAPLSAVLIPPGVRHRGVGYMRVLIYCTPKFDPEDEFFDTPQSSAP
jgi:mannose-6-phosphate isomerase-like protein (cupin superfamily)